MKRIRLLLFLLIIEVPIFAQINDNIGFEFAVRSGFFVPHRASLAGITNKHALLGFELNSYIQTNGKNEYSRAFNHPKFGISILGTNLSNNQILGYLLGGTIYADVPLIRKNGNEFSTSLGIGLAYVSHVYNSVNNPRNVAISSHLNILFNLGFKYRYYFRNSNIHLLAGLNLTHASNGATKMPNLGVNLVEPSLGIGFDTDWHIKTKSDSIEVDKRWKYGVQGVYSVQEVYPIGGKLHPVASLSFVVRKRFTKMSALQLNLDGFYKSATQYETNYDGKYPISAAQIGVFAGYNLYINRVRLTLGMGAYVYDKYKPNTLLYTRLSMEYLINKHFSVLLGIKSHYAKADYVEYGLCYMFN